MYSSDLFRQTNKVIKDTTRVSTARPFATTAPFLLKKAQPLTTGHTSSTSSVGGLPDQQISSNSNIEAPTDFPFEDKEWIKLLTESGMTKADFGDPSQYLTGTSKLREVINPLNIPATTYQHKAINTFLSPRGRSGQSVFTHELPPNISDRLTGYYITPLQKQQNKPALNPMYGLTGKQPFIETVTQAEDAYKEARDNFIRLSNTQGVSQEDLADAYGMVQESERYYGALLNSYYNLLNRDYYHGFYSRRDVNGNPVFMFFNPDDEARLNEAAYRAAWLRMLDSDYSIRRFLSSKLAEFYKNKLALHYSALRRGNPVPATTYASLIKSLIDSNFFLQDDDSLKSPKYELKLKSKDQPVSSELRTVRFLEQPPAHSLSSWLPSFITNRYHNVKVPEGESAGVMNQDNMPWFLWPQPISWFTSKQRLAPARFTPPPYIQNPPDTITIRPQIFKELAIGQNEGDLQDSRNIISGALEHPATYALAKLSILAAADKLTPNSSYALPLSRHTRDPVYMKVQYTVPTQNYYGETVRTGPPYLQVVADTEQDGSKRPKYYMLSHTFVPSNNGMYIVKQEIPVEADALNDKTHLQEPSPGNMVNHLMNVIKQQLIETNQYDKSQEPRLQQYKDNLLRYAEAFEKINTPEAVKSFINAATSGLSFLDNETKARVFNKFVEPGTFVVDPSSGRYYLNVGSGRDALLTNDGK